MKPDYKKDIKTEEEFYTLEQSDLIKQKFALLKPKATAFYITVIMSCIFSFCSIILQAFSFFDLPALQYVVRGLSFTALLCLVFFSFKYFRALKTLKKEIDKFE